MGVRYNSAFLFPRGEKFARNAPTWTVSDARPLGWIVPRRDVLRHLARLWRHGIRRDADGVFVLHTSHADVRGAGIRGRICGAAWRRRRNPARLGGVSRLSLVRAGDEFFCGFVGRS